MLPAFVDSEKQFGNRSMVYEYLLFNLSILSVAIIFGSTRYFYFHNRIKASFMAILLAAIPFIIWDISVAGTHWYYNDAYTMGIHFLGLPIEEWFFFISVPYACLFTWEMITRRIKDSRPVNKSVILASAVLFIIAGLVFSLLGKLYTALALSALGLVALFDQTFGAGILNFTRTYLFVVVVIVFTFVFNGYLTGRPIVLYNEQYQLGIRLFTTPIEDFGFGLGLLLLAVTLFEKFKKRLKGNS
jgi:lycopene cyclase domain-containing protein